ncbi:anti-sigma factor [Oerskovia flava]|uniref:anti-sigma factor n=1 Tax=Oerskovia flava TaxID=2986422 RepID=UPI00223ED221|nr:anti-sigma factor [Oerskovia sp. JB1-3-2]
MADDVQGTGSTGGPPTGGAWDLLPAYALDALDDLERRAVERLLETDPDARVALDEYRDVVAAFTVDAPAPAHLRSQTLAAVQDLAAAPTTPFSAPAGAPARRTSPQGAQRAPRRWGVALAAVAAVAAFAVPTTLAVQAVQEQRSLQEQADVVAQMLADPDARLVAAPVAGGGDASVLVSGDHALFTTAALPAAGPDEDYQLWVIDDGTISSAGVLTVRDGATTALVDASPGRVVAVTVEPAGGSEQPTTDPVVALET